MTDDVVEGRVSESTFRHAIVWLVGSRLAGTLLAQALLVPSAMLIVFVANACEHRTVGSDTDTSFRCSLPFSTRQ